MAEMSKVATVAVDGIPQAYVSEFSSDVMSEDKAVLTLLLGVAGYSDGAHSAKCSAKGAIPLAGRETDWRKLCVAHKTTKVSFKMGGSTLTMEGRFMNISERASVNAPNEWDFSFEGAILSLT